MWVSIPPAVAIKCAPLCTSVLAPIIILGVTLSIVSGLPACPMPTMRPSRIPISALIMPNLASMIITLIITKSNTFGLSRVAVPLCAMPSRTLLPPPNLHSSPLVNKSRSMVAHKLVSPKRTLSPTVGP